MYARENKNEREPSDALARVFHERNCCAPANHQRLSEWVSFSNQSEGFAILLFIGRGMELQICKADAAFFIEREHSNYWEKSKSCVRSLFLQFHHRSTFVPRRKNTFNLHSLENLWKDVKRKHRETLICFLQITLSISLTRFYLILLIFAENLILQSPSNSYFVQNASTLKYNQELLHNRNISMNLFLCTPCGKINFLSKMKQFKVVLAIFSPPPPTPFELKVKILRFFNCKCRKTDIFQFVHNLFWIWGTIRAISNFCYVF